VPSFIALAHQLRELFDDLDSGNVDVAAARLNRLLANHPAHAYLAKEDGRWRQNRVKAAAFRQRRVTGNRR
jgi:membrane-bound lytic murein transglycosylase MltF